MNDTLDTGYGISYGVNYGTGEEISSVWTVKLETAGGDSRLLVDAVLSVDIQPEHTALWDASIELAPVIDHTRFRFGEAAIRYEGVYWLGIDVESIEQADDGTVTITGREKAGEALLTEEIEAHYERTRTANAIRDFWRDRTLFNATVHDPPAGMAYGVPVASASTPAGFENILKSHPRDEKGRYLEAESGDAPNFEPTDPLQITPSGVELRQCNWVENGEESARRKEGAWIADDPDAVNGKTVKLPQSGSAVKWKINTKYDIPEFAVVPRWRCEGPTNDSTVTIDVDGSTLKTAALVNVCGPTYAWRYPPNFIRTEELPAGEHEITITNVTGDADIFVDIVSANDARFPYEWDNTLDNEKQLSGPELYPDDYYMRLDPVEPGIDVTDIYIDAEYSSVQPSTNMGLFSTQTGTVYRDQTDEFMEYRFSTPGEVPRIVPYPRLSRAGTRIGETPTTGFESQTLESLDISVDGYAVSVIHESGQTFSGSKLEVAQSLHEHAGYHFAIEHGNPVDGYRVESFSRGDPDLARGLPDEAIPTSASTSSGTGGYRNRVTVVGAKYPPAIRRKDDPRRFEKTVEDEGEIQQFGLHNITIHDDELTTQGAVTARAREELRQRLNEDRQGGSLGTTPAIVEPGYPYRVPEILGYVTADDVPHLGDIPNGETRTIGPGETVIVTDTATIGGRLHINGGRVVISSSGRMEVLDGGQTTPTARIGPGETVTVTGKKTYPNGVEIADTGTLEVTTGTVTVAGAGGQVVVENGGEIVARTVQDEIITCSTWSMTESAGSASASGEFGRLGGLGGEDASGILSLLNSAAEAD